MTPLPESPVPKEKDPLPGAASLVKHHQLVQGGGKVRTNPETCPWPPTHSPGKRIKGGEKAEVKQRQLCPCCHHPPEMHLPKETWAPSTAGRAGRWAPDQNLPRNTRRAAGSNQTQEHRAGKHLHCRQPQISKQANHYSHFLLQLEMTVRKELKSTYMISSQDSFLMSSDLDSLNFTLKHQLLWCSFHSSHLHSQLEVTCQFYQLDFRGFGEWKEPLKQVR